MDTQFPSVGTVAFANHMSEEKLHQMTRIKVLIVDDQILFRWGLMEALGRDETLEIVGEASNGNEAVEKAKALNPHVALMDLHMPDCDGVEATRRLRMEMPALNILMLTISEKDTDLFNALKAGARGYMLKNERPDSITEAIHYVARGGLIVSPSMATNLLNEFKMEPPALEGIAGGTADEPYKEDRPSMVQENVVGPGADVPGEDSAEPPVDGMEPASSAATTPPDVPMGNFGTPLEYELVISPPLDPSILMRLLQWLRKDVEAELAKVTPSWGGGDTVLNVTHRGASPLLSLLGGLPMVSEVMEEPYARETIRLPEELSLEETPEADVPHTVVSRLRLVLQAAQL